jgi:hypothetical protein
MDLQFLRQLPTDGMNRLTVRASAVTRSGPADLTPLTGLSRLSVYMERLAQPSAYSGQLAELRQVDGLRRQSPMPGSPSCSLRAPNSDTSSRTETGGRREYRGRFKGPTQLRPRDGATEVHQQLAEQNMQPSDPTCHPTNFSNSSLCPHR